MPLNFLHSDRIPFNCYSYDSVSVCSLTLIFVTLKRLNEWFTLLTCFLLFFSFRSCDNVILFDYWGSSNKALLSQPIPKKLISKNKRRLTDFQSRLETINIREKAKSI